MDEQNKAPLQSVSTVASQEIAGRKVIQPTDTIIQEQRAVTPLAAPSNFNPIDTQTSPETPKHVQFDTASIYPEVAQPAIDAPLKTTNDPQPENDSFSLGFNAQNLFQLAKVSAVTSLLFVVLLWLQLKTDGNLNFGKDSVGFISRFPYEFNIAAILFMLVIAVFSVTMIQRFTVLERKYAILLTIPAVSLIGVVYVYYIPIVLLFLGSFLSSLPGWLNVYPWMFFMNTCLLFIGLLLSTVLLQKTMKRPTLQIIFCLLLSVLLVGSVYGSLKVDLHIKYSRYSSAFKN